MDLDRYTMDDLILSALKAEVEAKATYGALANGVKNAYLKGRLEFLAEEEEKHRSYLDGLYRTQFPGREPELPSTTPVPMPEVHLPSEHLPLSEVFTQAMTAERAASEFYASFAQRFEEGDDARTMLNYFSKMEMGHYNLLETERDSARDFEEFDDQWPMMHAGP
jgi:rubrerythrin